MKECNLLNLFKDLLDEDYESEEIYNFSNKYQYSGTERVIISDNKVNIVWTDDTITKTELKEGDAYDIKLAILICIAKKFVKGLDLDKLYSNNTNPNSIKEILKQMIKSTAGLKCYKEFMAFADTYIIAQKYKELAKLRKDKKEKKRIEKFRKIEELKKEGKWCSNKEIEEQERQNELLRQKIAQQTKNKSNIDKLNELKEEYQKLQEEFNKLKNE